MNHDLSFLNEYLGFMDSFGRFTALNEEETEALISIIELEEKIGELFAGKRWRINAQVQFAGEWWTEQELGDRVAMLALSLKISVGIRHWAWVTEKEDVGYTVHESGRVFWH
jgi:hypothetical protein